MAEQKKKPIIENPKEVARALEVLFASDYIDVRKLHIENFIRGMFFGAGGVIGATVFIAVILWFLSLFDTVPLVGPFFENLKTTIESSNTN